MAMKCYRSVSLALLLGIPLGSAAARAEATAPKAVKTAAAPAAQPKAPAAQPKAPAAPVEDPFAAPKNEKAAPAEPEKPKVSYEELRKEATPVTDLATLIEPLYARCEDKDDLPRRQCEGVRDFLLARLRGRTFVTQAEITPEISPYDAAAKEIEMEISGCLTCVSPPQVAGEARYLAVRPPTRVVAGKAPGVPMASYQLPMETKVRADRFLERVVPRLRVEVIFKVGQPFGEEPAGQGQGQGQGAGSGQGAAKIRGVTVIPVGHRIYDRCTGQVTAATPQSGPVKVVADKTCPRRGAEELSEAELQAKAERAALPERLTPREVDLGLQPVQEKIHDCYVEFQELGGTVKVGLVIGGEGKITQMTLPPPYDKAPIGVCMRSQIRTAVFPKFRGEPMRVDYAFQVN
jgi:hypothetical protein